MCVLFFGEFEKHTLEVQGTRLGFLQLEDVVTHQSVRLKFLFHNFNSDFVVTGIVVGEAPAGALTNEVDSTRTCVVVVGHS